MCSSRRSSNWKGQYWYRPFSHRPAGEYRWLWESALYLLHQYNDQVAQYCSRWPVGHRSSRTMSSYLISSTTFQLIVRSQAVTRWRPSSSRKYTALLMSQPCTRFLRCASSASGDTKKSSLVNSANLWKAGSIHGGRTQTVKDHLLWLDEQGRARADALIRHELGMYN